MCCCCGCGLCACGETKSGLSRVFYFLWFLFSSVLAWVLRDYGAPALEQLPWGSDCSGSTAEAQCLGNQAVLRISFANLCFFLVHCVSLIGVRSKEDIRLVVHTSLWPLKLLAWGGITVGFFMVPSDVVYVYAQIARIVAGFFLIAQLIVLLDFVYRVNGSLIDRDECLPVLLAMTLLSFGLGIASLGVQYWLFAPSAGCGLNIFLITFTLILGIAAAIVSVLPNRNKEAGLFTASAVFLYGCFLCYSALSSEPNSAGTCERFPDSQKAWITVCGYLIALSSIGWSALSGGSQKDTFTFDISSEMRHEEGDDGSGEELTFSPSLFHLMFTFASTYLGMVLTGWNWEQQGNGVGEVDTGEISLWVKISAQWVCFLLYVWTVIAPILLPDRDFS